MAAAEGEAEETTAGECLGVSPGIGVAEAALLAVVVFQDVGDRFFDGRVGDLGSVELGGAQGHERPSAAREIGIARIGLVTPATLMALVFWHGLSLEEELRRLGEDGVDALLHFGIDHTADFGEEEGCDVVRIHQAVTRVALVEKSVAALAREDVFETTVDVLGVVAVFRQVTGREKGHADERDDADGAAVRVGVGAVLGLVRREVTQGLFHRRFDRGLVFLKDRLRGRFLRG